MTILISVLAAVIGVSSFTLNVTETVSGNQHTEQVAIIEGNNDTYTFHRALGDTVTVQEGFKTGELYCFRDFRNNGEVTVCRIDGDVLFGLSLTSLGFLFSFTSGEDNPMTPDMTGISGIYGVVCGQDGTELIYKAVLNVYPDGQYWWVEQDFDGDENAEKSGFGMMVDGVFVAAMELIAHPDNWNLTAYRFSADGNAQGRWLTRFYNDETFETETVTGWENLEYIEDFDY